MPKGKLVSIQMRPNFWRVLIILASTLYLAPHVNFNAGRTNVSGQEVVGEDTLRHIELFRRMISDIGVFLGGRCKSDDWPADEIIRRKKMAI